MIERQVPKLLNGQDFMDERGSVYHYGATALDSIKRLYFISPSQSAGFRGWHGHKFESKTFRCIRGSFEVSSVRILDWDAPSGGETYKFHLSADSGELLIVPEGFANGILCMEVGSVLMVMSNKTLSESLEDDFRFDPSAF
jgi:dTDP-4-dehydrorhamnose 3,5-epimerase-like enzyme